MRRLSGMLFGALAFAVSGTLLCADTALPSVVARSQPAGAVTPPSGMLAVGSASVAASTPTAMDADAIRTALSQKREPLLLSPAYDDAAVYAMVLERFPLGTPRTTILKEFATHFAVYDWRLYPHNGIWIGRDGVAHRRGTHQMTFTVFRDWPLGLGAPLVAYRYVQLNFDGDADLTGGEPRLLDVRVRSEIDAP